MNAAGRVKQDRSHGTSSTFVRTVGEEQDVLATRGSNYARPDDLPVVHQEL